MKNQKRLSALSLFLLCLLVGCSKHVHAQVPVAMAPPIHFQFLNSSGNPLALGKVFTYAAGTTTLQNTYVDASGTTLNPDPILLDSTGSPSNGSVQTGIFLSNTAWKFVAFDQNNVQQWSVDNVTTYFALTNSANTWTATQTFSAQIIDTLTDNQMAFGAPGNQTTADFPPPSGNVTLHFPSIGETVIGKTDVVSGAAFANGCGIVNGPGTYICVANANPTGTSTGSLAKLINTPAQATISATTDTGGIIGICVAACGNTGTATIQQSGLLNCNMDSATTAGDYVQISLVAGDCHDAGAAYPTSGQVIGRAIGGSGGSAPVSIDLFGPELQSAPPLGTQYINSTYANTTTSFTNIPSFSGTFGFTGVANTNYTMTCNFMWQGSAATAGPKFQVTAPALSTVSLGLISGVTASTGTFVAVSGISTQSLANTGTVTVATLFPVTLTIDVIMASGGGPVTLQGAANGAGTLSIVGGYCLIK